MQFLIPASKSVLLTRKILLKTQVEAKTTRKSAKADAFFIPSTDVTAT